MGVVFIAFYCLHSFLNECHETKVGWGDCYIYNIYTLLYFLLQIFLIENSSWRSPVLTVLGISLRGSSPLYRISSRVFSGLGKIRLYQAWSLLMST